MPTAFPAPVPRRRRTISPTGAGTLAGTAKRSRSSARAEKTHTARVVSQSWLRIRSGVISGFETRSQIRRLVAGEGDNANDEEYSKRAGW
jgi:hypothetical protein